MIDKNNELSKAKKCANERSSLDTLAQLGTNGENDADFALNKQTKSSDKRPLQNRAKRKFLATSLAVGLVSAVEHKQAKQNDECFLRDYDKFKKRKKAYWNMYHCARTLKKQSGKITGRYCKNRLCLVCNSIRQAQLLKGYAPIVESWGDDAYLLTLTVQNVKGKKLRAAIEEMKKIVIRIQGRIKKQLQRYNKPTMDGIRKVECTHNYFQNNYHPHFHILIRGNENARKFRKYWVQTVAKSKILNCKLVGKQRNGKRVFLQDLRRANKGAAKELLKYFTKIISSRDKKRRINCAALDTIFDGLVGTRTIQGFGNAKLSKEAQQAAATATASEGNETIYTWDQNTADWIDQESGELLSEHALSKYLEDITTRIK